MNHEDIKLGEIYCFEWLGTNGLAQPYSEESCGDFTPDDEPVDGYRCFVYDELVPEVGIEGDWFLEAVDLSDTISDQEKKLFYLKSMK